jgi:hypothetical protein
MKSGLQPTRSLLHRSRHPTSMKKIIDVFKTIADQLYFSGCLVAPLTVNQQKD